MIWNRIPHSISHGWDSRKYTAKLDRKVAGTAQHWSSNAIVHCLERPLCAQELHMQKLAQKIKHQTWEISRNKIKCAEPPGRQKLISVVADGYVKS
jgi:hypothetical protein